MKTEKTLLLDELTVSAFAVELLRHDLLDEILGKEKDFILYCAGKRIADKYPLYSIEEMVQFFNSAGWGILQLEKEKNDELQFSLTGSLITFRLQQKATFQLEAGFLAAQIQRQKKLIAECHEQTNNRREKVTFTVRWDIKDSVENNL
ncbi:YslB family protein [Bacillus sp. HMF5848]|uniref:YslB family protein n=1 Tax=Bacillus sp. HMF5848 TaxID=2495421 RepID=UPI0021AE08F2|nr:YslB family protein [Bacillus sp. HMF5848]